jgi:hypothetical protein
VQAQVAHQGHAGVDAFGLTRVNAVVVEEHRTAGGLDLLRVKHAVFRKHAHVDGHTGVRAASLFKP